MLVELVTTKQDVKNKSLYENKTALSEENKNLV